MASLLAPVLSLLRRPRAQGSGEGSGEEATPAAPLPSLPLELAGPFYDTSTLVAVSRTTKGCAASKMLSVQWAGVLTRRFPCLAALPAFQAPLADAKAVVKGLLTATPPPPEPPRRGRSRGGARPSYHDLAWPAVPGPRSGLAARRSGPACPPLTPRTLHGSPAGLFGMSGRKMQHQPRP